MLDRSARSPVPSIPGWLRRGPVEDCKSPCLLALGGAVPTLVRASSRSSAQPLLLACLVGVVVLWGCDQQIVAPNTIIPPTINTATLPAGVIGANYSHQLSASGGDGAYVWSVGGGKPGWLSLSSGGLLSGAPDEVGQSSFEVRVESVGLSTLRVLELVVGYAPPKIQSGDLLDGVVGVAYLDTLRATGGDGSFTWTVANSSLPPGLSLSASGVFRGTPQESGEWTFTVSVSSASQAAEAQKSFLVTNPSVTVATGALPGGAVGESYSAALAASGGDGTFSWSLTGGSLPSGLSLNTSGTISGTPSAAATSSFTVQVTSAGQTSSKSLSITIQAATPAPTITTTSLPNGTVGQAYSQTLAATGGDGSYSWSLAGGNLPAGLSLNTSGTISGTPSAAATSSFTVQVTSAGQTSSKSLSVTVASAASHTVSVSNYLRLPIVVSINDVVLGQVDAGSASLPKLRNFTVSAQSSIKVEWGVVKVRIAGTDIEVGDDMGGTFNTVLNPGPQLSYDVDNVIGEETFFYPVVDNQIGESALFAFNWGLSFENRCNCQSSASGNTGFGYFRAEDDSNVRAYQVGSNYTGAYVYWDLVTLGVLDFRNALAALDGYLALQLQIKPWAAPSLNAGRGGNLVGFDGGSGANPSTRSDDVFSVEAAKLGRLATHRSGVNSPLNAGKS